MAEVGRRAGLLEGSPGDLVCHAAGMGLPAASRRRLPTWAWAAHNMGSADPAAWDGGEIGGAMRF